MQALTWQYGFGVQLDLVGGLSAYATLRHVLRQLRGEGWEAGLLVAHNLNLRGRPLRGRAGLGYSRQRVGREWALSPTPMLACAWRVVLYLATNSRFRSRTSPMLCCPNWG